MTFITLRKIKGIFGFGLTETFVKGLTIIVNHSVERLGVAKAADCFQAVADYLRSQEPDGFAREFERPSLGDRPAA